MEAATTRDPATGRLKGATEEPAPAAPPSAGWKPADPGPLGLAAFAMTTFVLSMFNSGLVSDASMAAVVNATFGRTVMPVKPLNG